ncbi:MAG TPA: phospholipase D-like domain-containing protein [Gemmatimonadales bacterium]
MTVPAPAPATPGRPGRSATLDRALDRACGARPVPGNRVRYLTDTDVFDAMRALLRDAAAVVHFENYIIRDDATGREFAGLLADAAGRGVTVRVLYDAFGCRWTGRAYWDRLRRSGVEVRALGVRLLHPLRSLRRNHRKYVGVDGRIALVGGFCIGDEWVGDPARRRMPWRDTAVEICGPAAAALDLTFERLWARLGPTLSPPDRAVRVEACGPAAARVVDGLPGRMRIYRAVELLAASAASRLWISDAYLVAPAPMFAALMAAARDGVDVRVLVPGTTDVPAVRAFTRVGYRELLAAGARIWEWRGPMFHAKTVIADDRWVKVGSSNLNVPSLLANYELDLLLDDPPLATEAVAQFRRDLSHAMEVTLRPRRVPAGIAKRLPPAVAPTGPVTRHPAHTPSAAEVSVRAAITLRHVAEGARRSIAGAVVFTSVGLGALFVAAPRVMGTLVALASFWVAAQATAAFFARRRHGDEPASTPPPDGA